MLIVIPTLGKRLPYLDETLASIRAQEVPSDIVLVAPEGDSALTRLAHEWDALSIPDPGGLAAAINSGVAAGLREHQFVTWLNDDDRLCAGSLTASTSALSRHVEAVVAFGACRYIDGRGRQLWISRAGAWAPRILSWGPDLIPQPGMLIRTSAWQRVGGLDESYRLAFDLDLLLRLRRLGQFVNVKQVVSEFRWHPDSLTVDGRETNIAESERARRSALGPTARKCVWMWERPVRIATRYAAGQLNRRASRLGAE